MAGCKANGGLTVNRVKIAKEGKEKEKNNADVTIGPDLDENSTDWQAQLERVEFNLKVSPVSELFIPDAIHPPIPFPRRCYTYRYLYGISQDWRVSLQREPPRRAWSRPFY